MKSRIPLIVAVVGTLLVGGATTGTTRASWTNQAPLQQHSVTSGQLSYTATTPAGVTVDRAAGSTADTTVVLDDTSAGKNLTQRITATVTGTPTGVTATIGTTCPGSASVAVDTTPTGPDQTLCVRVTSSSAAVTGNVVIELSSAQRPTGWTTDSMTRSVMVTVNQPVYLPVAPVLQCGSFAGNGTFSFTWTPVSGETYTVHRSTTTNTETSYSTVPTPPAHTSPYAAAMPNPSVTFWRVKASSAAGTSAWSNTIQLTRTGNGSAAHQCTPVTP